MATIRIVRTRTCEDYGDIEVSEEQLKEIEGYDESAIVAWAEEQDRIGINWQFDASADYLGDDQISQVYTWDEEEAQATDILFEL
jgi:hypothetical protein